MSERDGAAPGVEVGAGRPRPPVNAAGAEVHGPRQRGWILAALMLTMMLAAMDTTIVSTAIPQIVADLGGFRLFSWLFSIYLLAQTVTIPIYGKLADTFGRKPILLIGASVFLVGSLASAAAWDMPSLIAFRGLQGLGAGSIMATVNTLAGDLYSVRERARIQGWLSSMWGIAAIVGPTLGGAFAEYASWRWIFLINLPIGVAALALLARFLREEPAARKHRIDYAGATLLMLAVGALMLALLQGGQAWAWDSVASIGSFAVSVVLLLLLVLVERRAAEPIQPRWLWRRPVLVGSNLAMVGMGLVMMGPNTYLPTFGQSVLGLGPIAAGLLLACISLGWPFASSLSGWLYLRIGFRDAGLVGSFFVVAAVGGFLLLPDGAPLGWLVVDQIVLGAGFGFLSTPLLVGVQSTVGWHERGVVTGANVFSRYLGQSLGAAVAGAIFNGSLARALEAAPAGLAAALPARVDEVIATLGAHAHGDPVALYLQGAIRGAMRHVYAGLLVVAVAIVLAVLVAPREFPVVSEGTA